MPFWDSLVNGVTDFFGGSGGGGGGSSIWGDLTPFDATTVADSVVSPADIFTNVPGLVSTPDLLSSFVGGGLDFFGGGGGGGGGSPGSSTTRNPLTSVLSNPNTVGTVAKTLLGGGASGGAAGAGGTGAGAGVGAGGGIGGLGSLLSNPALLGMVPGLMSAINSKDQTNLGPDAAAMRGIATKNQGVADSLSAEAAQERMGNLPGPAAASIQRSLEEQRAAFRTSYSRMGMSGGSAEAADMAALNEKAESQRFQIGMNMAAEAMGQVSGINSQDISIYGQLMSEQAARDREYMDAMAKLAEGFGKAFAGPSGVTPGQGAPETRGTGDPATPTSFPSSLFPTGPIDPSSLLTVLGGVDPSSLISPVTNVPDLVPTGTGLPDPSRLDPSVNPDLTAAWDFLSNFQPAGA